MSNPKYGVHRPLEDEADRLLKESMRGVTSQRAKSDILTPWKERDRLSREVYSSDGVVDAATRRGIYGRAYNPTSPHLNSRDGHTRGSRTRVQGLQAFVAEHGTTPDTEA
jgi:hypothetical protein